MIISHDIYCIFSRPLDGDHHLPEPCSPWCCCYLHQSLYSQWVTQPQIHWHQGIGVNCERTSTICSRSSGAFLCQPVILIIHTRRIFDHNHILFECHAYIHIILLFNLSTHSPLHLSTVSDGRHRLLRRPRRNIKTKNPRLALPYDERYQRRIHCRQTTLSSHLSSSCGRRAFPSRFGESNYAMFRTICTVQWMVYTYRDQSVWVSGR